MGAIVVGNYSMWDIIKSIKKGETDVEDWKSMLDNDTFDTLTAVFDKSISINSELWQ